MQAKHKFPYHLLCDPSLEVWPYWSPPLLGFASNLEAGLPVTVSVTECRRL